ncbi:primosomal protein N' [Candidatus Liberibacter africanus]|uniref:Replication restart protein PriA n=1 Tax=Candidatus Liberibacter africanus PTSAPSY TaxID=1277257 RepID=A0A0G3I6X7_LIBAF|nr:primosomal protein N' [Candidatus Liberibacter africanus]AKK20288.1 primosome assembly protein PriA [Candidatus Liberibacter africanus PTSAPSY]QTP64047.1 primosomal protein N' [Candidatus Liberibacter africanus]
MVSLESSLEEVVRSRVVVLLLQSVSGPYVYSVPCGMGLELGSIVRVPLRSRTVLGIVWHDSEQEQNIAHLKLRPVEYVFDCPPLSGQICEFIKWVAKYTFSSVGLVARMVVSALSETEKMEEKIQFTGVLPRINTEKRLRVLNEIKDGSIWRTKDLICVAQVSYHVINGLKEQGVIKQMFDVISPVVDPPNIHFSAPRLEKNQKDALEQIIPLCANGFSVSLISGVTGSGKTEVYLEIVAATLRLGKQVLILLPEISLTSAILERFHKRFGVKPAEWRSSLSSSMREKIWRQIARGTISVVVGVRSALFLPFKKLGLIVIDEEHDVSYKQEEGVLYNARDMSIVRGKIESFPVVLVSATPSIESRVNGMNGRYRFVHLSTRYRNSSLPHLRVIDMRSQAVEQGRFLSVEMIDHIKNTLERDEQTLLFLNRRGYAPLTLCRVCGHRIKCPYCSCWLVEHRSKKKLYCHQCGYVAICSQSCVACGSSGQMISCGPGVERIAEEVHDYFPMARISILSSDVEGGVDKLRLQLEAIAKGEIDIVIGTQLVAKGHNFPRMSLVGVVDGDLGLANADLRSSERTFQLLSQVTGRAGRFGLKSTGLIQVYQPEHPVIKALVSGDADSFYESEILSRKEVSLPPFGRLAAVIVFGKKCQEVEKYAYILKENAPISSDIMIFGPAESPLFMVRGNYRFRLLIHGKRNSNLQSFFAYMCANAPKRSHSLRVQFDMDPQNFL